MSYKWMSTVDPATIRSTDPVNAIKHWHAEYLRLMEASIEISGREVVDPDELRTVQFEKNIAAARMAAYVPYVLDMLPSE